MGMKLPESGFQSWQAADFAGKTAVSDFPIELAQEGKQEEKSLLRPRQKSSPQLAASFLLCAGCHPLRHLAAPQNRSLDG
jgi:hypothetical protein